MIKKSQNIHGIPHKKIRGRIWVEGSQGTFMGWGRVALLEGIREYGSITKAAKSMNMAYRHAWKLVDSMNRQSRKPLVEVAIGGKGGGGAWLTKEGEKSIRLFRQFAGDFDTFLVREQKKLSF